MYAQVDKTKESNSDSVVNTTARKKSRLNQPFGFVDNRSRQDVQRKQYKVAEKKPSVAQLKNVQEDSLNCQGINLSWPENGSVVQRVLIDNDFSAWKDIDFEGVPVQLNEVRDAINAYNESDQDAKLRQEANHALDNLAGVLSGGEIVQRVFDNLNPVIPGLQLHQISLQAANNFNGPISLSLENVLAWLRIADNEFTLDDVRYVRHELVEIRALQDAGVPATHLLGPEIRPEGEDYDVFYEGTEEIKGFNEHYDDAHRIAIDEEVEFLTCAVNHVHPDLGATQMQVAHSHPSRTEDFLKNFPSNGVDTASFDENDEIQLDGLEHYNADVKDAVVGLNMDDFNLGENADIFRIDNLPTPFSPGPQEDEVVQQVKRQLNPRQQADEDALNALNPPVFKQHEVISGDIIQGVFVYSFIHDSIVETNKSGQYYTGLNFKKIVANGITAWSDVRNTERTRFLLKVMSYQELQENTPTASSISNHVMGGDDALGIQGLVLNIINNYPPAKYQYLSPGASGDMIVTALNRMVRVPVYRLALSSITYNNLDELNTDSVKLDRFKAYMHKSIGDMLADPKPIVIIDAVDKGASMLTMKKMIELLDREMGNTNRSVEMMSLNITKGALKEKGIREIEGDTESKAFVKNRIYWQQYKQNIPRIYTKMPIADILAGTITEPPAPDVQALAAQNEEIDAMIMGMYIGQYIVSEDENTVRALMSQLGMTREQAVVALEPTQTGETEFDSDDDSFV